MNPGLVSNKNIDFNFQVGYIHQNSIIIYRVMDTVFFLSDAHLGIQSADHPADSREKQIGAFLEHIGKRATRLYINGDLFDFWFEYHHVIPRCYFQTICHLKQLVSKGIQIEYVCGNHDFWLGSFFENQLGIKVHRDYIDTTINGKRFHIAHGDGLAKKDIGYRILKKILRNPVNIRLYRMIHPYIGFKLALFFSRLSRNHGPREDDREDYLLAAQERLKQGYHYVVFGHTHHPCIHIEENGTYLNTGDWTHHFSYGEFSNNQLNLKYWRTK